MRRLRWLVMAIVVLATWQWLHRPAITLTGSEEYPAWLMGSWRGDRDSTFSFQPEGKGDVNYRMPFHWQAHSGVITFSDTADWLDKHSARYAMIDGGANLQLTWDDGKVEVYHQLP